MTKSKRPQSRPRSSRTSDPHISHLHVVIDEKLLRGLEAHARKLEGPRAKTAAKLNLSAAARDAMRRGLGLRVAEAA